MHERREKPGAHEVHIWQAELEKLQPFRKRMMRLLSGDERARAERFRNGDDRQRFIVGRGALRILLGYYLAIDPASVELLYGDNGKPSLAFGEKVTFNLSHAGDALVIATGHGCDVGIDIERLDSMIDLRMMGPSVLHPNELQSLSDCNGPEMIRLFYRYWTHKEAYLKALGVGLAGDMKSVELVLSEEGSSVRLVDHSAERSGSGWRIYELEYSPAYMAAVAVGRVGVTFKRYLISELV